MKHSSSIGRDGVNDRKVFHLLFFFTLSLGLFFGPQSPLLDSINEDGHFLEATQISASNSTFSDSNAIESAKVENEEKEEKEEKESESELEDSDVFTPKLGSEFPFPPLSSTLSNAHSLFESYSKEKLYILFHCLKSDLD
jgi:hypothetical protein